MTEPFITSINPQSRVGKMIQEYVQIEKNNGIYIGFVVGLLTGATVGILVSIFSKK
jgi:hypothetical protein